MTPSAVLVPILPPMPGDVAGRVMANLEAVMGWVRKVFDQDYEMTVRTWTNKPPWKVVSERGQDWSETHGTDSAVYKFVSGGTRPHAIAARRVPALVFQTGYKPKTAPGRLVSVPGGASGPIARAKVVQHPGTQARDFDKQVAWKWSQEFPRRAQEAVTAAFK